MGCYLVEITHRPNRICNIKSCTKEIMIQKEDGSIDVDRVIFPWNVGDRYLEDLYSSLYLNVLYLDFGGFMDYL